MRICHTVLDLSHATKQGEAHTTIPCKIAKAVGIFDRWAATRIRALPDAYTGVQTFNHDGRFSNTTGLRKN